MWRLRNIQKRRKQAKNKRFANIPKYAVAKTQHSALKNKNNSVYSDKIFSEKEEMLTASQERYCQERANGKNQRAAMLIAYPQRKAWKPTSVDRRATELEKKSHIKAHIEELKKPQLDALEANRREIIDKLVSIAKGEEEATSVQLQALTKLIDKLVPTKHENKNENKHTFEDFLKQFAESEDFGEK